MRVNSYFYNGYHLGSTSVVLDIDGNISQSVTCVPYGEISFVNLNKNSHICREKNKRDNQSTY